jgi:hypothetical protein
MNDGVHMFVGELLHDRIIGALELCCRRGEMLLIQNKRVNWETHQIGIPGPTAKDKENRRIPFNPKEHSAHTSEIQTGPKCRFVNARPEPDFRYFSKRRARCSSGN